MYGQTLTGGAAYIKGSTTGGVLNSVPLLFTPGVLRRVFTPDDTQLPYQRVNQFMKPDIVCFVYSTGVFSKSIINNRLAVMSNRSCLCTQYLN